MDGSLISRFKCLFRAFKLTNNTQPIFRAVIMTVQNF